MENQEFPYPGGQQRPLGMVVPLSDENFHFYQTDNIRMEINIIACVDANFAIGYKNQLLFHIPEDMKRFRTLTTGHTVLMGRKTYDSLPNGALPNRRNIVVSRQNLQLENCEVFPSIEEALATCQDEAVFVIGGATIYEQTLHLASKIYLTLVETESTKADVFFPKFKKENWLEEKKNNINILTSNTKETVNCTFYIYKKKR